MFAARTKALVKNLGAEEELIHNENVNQKIELLTLVKVGKKTLWPVVKYTTVNLTLLDLLQDRDFTPEYKEEVLMEDFHNLKGICIGGRAATEADAAKAEVSAAMDIVDRASPFNLTKRTVDIEKLRKSCEDKEIKGKVLTMLKLGKNEKLTFVNQTVYNTAPVTFYGKAVMAKDFVGTLCQKFRCSLQKKHKEETSFTIPKDITFAYSLMDICTEENTLGIPPQFIKMGRHNKGWWKISSDADGDDQTLQQLLEETFDKAVFLQPLAEICESRRHDLLEKLRKLLEEGDALSLLEETLEQSDKGVFEPPQSPAVSSFMNLLAASEVSSSQKDAAHFLVSAMDALPDNSAAFLAKCDPETLSLLQHLVDSLKEGAQAKLQGTLPDSLQEEGELRWAAELLCLNDQTLTELRAQWDTPESPPEVMLELVCHVVEGLSLMQS